MAQKLIKKLFLGMVILTIGSSASFAGALPADVLSSGYMYSIPQVQKSVINEFQPSPAIIDSDDDLEVRFVSGPGYGLVLRGNVYLAPAIDYTFRSLVADTVTQIRTAIAAHSAALFVINQGAGHFSAAVVREDNRGNVVILYNDSTGASYSSAIESRDLIDNLLREFPGATVIDAQVQNQTGGVACGGYASNYLILMADNNQLPDTALNLDSVRNLLRTAAILKDERLIRIESYLKSLDPNRNSTVLVNDLVKALNAGEHAKQMQAAIYNNLDFITSELNSRMDNLVMAYGDDSLGAGIWVSGAIGSSTYKVKNSTFFGDSKEKSSNINFGGDIKLNDTYMIGAFVSLSQNSLKPSINSTVASSKTNIDSTVFGIYGSWMVTEEIMLNSSVYGGKVSAKNKDTSQIGSNRKGTLRGANLGATYFWKLSRDMVLAPSIGAMSSRIKLGKDNNSVLLINSLTGKRAGLYAGVSLSKRLNVGEFTLVPEISAKVTYSPMIKSNHTIVTDVASNILLPVSSPDPLNKIMFSAGASLKVLRTNIIEFNLGYQRDWQSQYLANTGSAKLKINF